MKLKEGFVLREVAGQTVVLPSGASLNLDMMISLNETGKFLWKQLEQDCDAEALEQALLAEYDVDEPTAKRAVAGFVGELREHGFLQD